MRLGVTGSTGASAPRILPTGRQSKIDREIGIDEGMNAPAWVDHDESRCRLRGTGCLVLKRRRMKNANDMGKNMLLRRRSQAPREKLRLSERVHRARGARVREERGHRSRAEMRGSDRWPPEELHAVLDVLRAPGPSMRRRRRLEQRQDLHLRRLAIARAGLARLTLMRPFSASRIFQMR